MNIEDLTIAANAAYFEYGWYAAGAAVLIGWFWRTDRGENAFVGAPERLNTIGMVDLAITAILFMSVPALNKILVGDFETGQWDKFNLFFITSIWGHSAVLILLIIMIKGKFAGGLKGLGIKTDGIAKMSALALWYGVIAIGMTFLTQAITLEVCKSFGYEAVQKHKFLEYLSAEPPRLSTALSFFSIGVITPIMEELIFRGVILSCFTGAVARYAAGAGKLYSANSQASNWTALARWTGIFGSSFIFAVLHADIQHWPPLFILGTFFGYAYERTGNLLVPILMHIMFNLLPLTATVLSGAS